MTDNMTFSRTSDFADEKTTVGDNCLLKRFDFYTLDFKRFTHLKGCAPYLFIIFNFIATYVKIVEHALVDIKSKKK